jgi:hypothetical protein
MLTTFSSCRRHIDQLVCMVKCTVWIFTHDLPDSCKVPLRLTGLHPLHTLHLAHTVHSRVCNHAPLTRCLVHEYVHWLDISLCPSLSITIHHITRHWLGRSMVCLLWLTRALGYGGVIMHVEPPYTNGMLEERKFHREKGTTKR